MPPTEPCATRVSLIAIQIEGMPPWMQALITIGVLLMGLGVLSFGAAFLGMFLRSFSWWPR